MGNSEKVFLALMGVALVAVILWRDKLPAIFNGPDVVVTPDSVDNSGNAMSATGPSWLVYNQPYMFNAAMGNVLPTRSIGQVGQVGDLGAAENFTYNDCGCS